MAKKENKAARSDGGKRKKTTSSQASASAKKAGTGTSASTSESGAGTSGETGSTPYGAGGNQVSGSEYGGQQQEQQNPWNSSSGYGNMGAQQQQQQQPGGGMGYPGTQGGFGSPQGQWNEDPNQGQHAGQYQQHQQHWDKSYDSLKHHGLEGNRNASDWVHSHAGNRGDNRGGQQWEQPANWNQQADWNQGTGSANWQGPQRDYQGGGVYHSGGEYRQQDQYSSFGQGFGQANQSWQDPGNRREEESRRGWGAGNYSGEQNRERGRSIYEGNSYENSGYNQFYEMGGYDPRYRREEERYSGSSQHQDYGSGARGSYRDEHYERNQQYGGPSGYGNYSGAYDRDSHFSAGGISSMGGDYDREGSRGRQYGANYDSEGNFIGSYDRGEVKRDSREWRQDSDRGGSGYNSGFDRGRQNWNQEYDRQRRDSGWGSERGYDQYENAYGQRQDPWGVPGRGDSDSRYRGYPSGQSNYAGSGSYGQGNRYDRADAYDNDQNHSRSAGYDRDQDDNRHRGPRRFYTGDDSYDYRDYGAAPQGYNRNRGRYEEEGFIDKAADRVRSWFGGREEDRHHR